MLARTIIFAVAMTLAGISFASARSHHHYRHHHGWFTSRNVSLHQSGAPASVSPLGGDRAPITGGGY